MSRRARGPAWGCLAALGIACALAAPAVTTGCTTHQCDSDFVDINQSTGMNIGDVQASGTGFALWESSPFDGTWIDFPGQRTYFFTLPAGFVAVQPPTAWVATDLNPNPSGGATIVLGGGQLAEISNVGGNGGFLITNGTCAEYYLYVSVLGIYAPAGPTSPADAATD